jgi:hypothetical protein
MMVSKREARTNRRKALAETWERMTTVSKIRKLFASGRPRTKDERLSSITAYGQAGSLFERVQEAMMSAKLDPADVRGLLIVSERDGEGNPMFAHPFPLNRVQMDEVLPALLRVHNALPVGVAFSILDREETDPAKKFKQWATPFLADATSQSILKQYLDVIQTGAKRMAYAS